MEKFLVVFPQSWDLFTSPKGPISPDQVMLGHSLGNMFLRTSLQEVWAHSSALATHSERGRRRRDTLETDDFAVVL